MNDALIELTADIVSAYVSNNPVSFGDLPGLIQSVSNTLERLENGMLESEQEAPTPAVNPKKSVHHDHLVCLEDGMKFKSMKRHLMTSHGMTPDEYRARWNLPADYPMVAPGYAAARSSLAKKMGLGRKQVEAPAPKGSRKAKA